MFFTNINNEHWVVLYKDNDVVEYFDSLGERPSGVITSHMQTVDFISNEFVLQRDASDLNCGLYCVMYAFCKLVKNMTMNQVVTFICEVKSGQDVFQL